MSTFKKYYKKSTSFHQKVYLALGSALKRNGRLAQASNFILNSAYFLYKSRKGHALTPLAPDFDTPRYLDFYEKCQPLHGKHVCIIAELSIPQCQYYRVDQRVQELEELGYTAQVASWTDFLDARDAMQTASAVFFYRVPFVESVQNLYKEAERLGIQKYFEVDDLVFDKEEYKKNGNIYRLSEEEQKNLLDGVDLYRDALLHADGVIVSTETLAQFVRDMNKNAFVIHNAISPDLIALSEERGKKRPENRVKIFYGSGTRTHDEDFLEASEALLTLLASRDTVDLYIHGTLQLPPEFEAYASRVFHIGKIDIENYYRAIGDYDIALSPLKNTVFNDAKSNIKFLEASIFGLPSVCSAAAEFSNVIQHGENGFIAETPQEWLKCLLELVDDAQRRETVGTAARESVIDNFSYKSIAHNELAPIATSWGQASAQPKRVLLVNVLYGKNSFGGATHVVESIAQNLQTCGIQPCVFTTIQDASLPEYSLVRYEYNGVTVFAANTHGTPPDQTYNPKVHSLFEQVLQAEHIDLVHFHCIQDIGTGPLEICSKQKLPYIVTVHDAWWLCPHQFMIDRDGVFCDQKQINPAQCNARCGISFEELFTRKTRMEKALKGASKILAPSDFFAHFLNDNFPHLPKVGTNINGMRPVKKKCQRTTGNEALVLGYVGGKAKHKGYYFLKEALASQNWPAYKLVIPDIHLAFGSHQISAEEWPNPHSVEVVEPYSAENIDDFYASIDVLIFPSLWDESFGLTIREAISRNVFVLSSECGGPSECITHGVNGLLFPKGDKTAFNQCLDSLFEKKNDIKNYTSAHFGDIRSYQEQARELAAIYTEVCDNEKY